MITTDPLKELRVNGDRLLRRLEIMARSGATPSGRVSRLALTGEDKAGRDQFVRWARRAGCAVSVDKIGNIFARRTGLDNGLLPVMVIGHTDTPPEGDKFDGAYGLLAGLEVVETLNDVGIDTERPIEIASWTNSEGIRFSPAMSGSAVFAGAIDLDSAHENMDQDGLSLVSELEKIGYAGTENPGGRSFKAAFELTAEPGPILTSSAKQIGTVSGVQGIRWYEVIITGQEAHAGTTPMDHRRDPMRAMMAILDATYDLAARYAPDARVTVGDIQADPGRFDTVPGCLTLKLDLRHPEKVLLRAMHQAFHELVYDVCNMSGMNGEVHDVWNLPPVVFDAGCLDSVRKAIRTVGVASMDVVSGVGYDAAYVSQVAPSCMIFVPSVSASIQQDEASVNKFDATAGASVLLHAVLDQALS